MEWDNNKGRIPTGNSGPNVKLTNLLDSGSDD